MEPSERIEKVLVSDFTRQGAWGQHGKENEIDLDAPYTSRWEDAVCDVEVEEIIRGLREIAFPSGDTKVNNSDRNRALELLGKYKSIFSERFIFGEDEQTMELNENQKIEAEVLVELRFRYGDEIRKAVEMRIKNSQGNS